jgi:membrane-bound lytic murein transglycosylase B
VKIYHYWKDDRERDLTNKFDSVNDLLVAAGIVKNDNWQVIKKIHSEGESYKGQITKAITRIDVTQSYFD